MPQVADVSHWLWHRPWSLVRDTGNVGKQRQWMLKACSYDPFTNAWKTRAAPSTGGALARIQLDGHSHVLSVDGSGSVGSLPVASHLYAP